MDPVTAFIAAYLTTATNQVNQQVSDIYGTAIKTEFIEYEGMNISFQYQMWRIKHNTVCSSYSQKMAIYSQCTIKAKVLFNSLCKELSERKDSHWKAKKIKNMFCTAGVAYKPVIANISNPKELSESRANEKKCNLLILKTMNNRNKDLIAEKKLVCGKNK